MVRIMREGGGTVALVLLRAVDDGRCRRIEGPRIVKSERGSDFEVAILEFESH